MIKNFAIFKNLKAVHPQPGYNMVGKDEAGNKLNLAAVWVKDYKDTKYYSGQMKEEFIKEDGTKIEGYVIITQTEYDELKGVKKEEVKEEYPTDEIDPDNIPF